MINVSDSFKQLMNQRTDFKENAEVILSDGTLLNLTERDFTISNNSVTDAADANAVPLGAAICRSIQIELLNDDDHLEKYDFTGARIRLYLTFRLKETTEKIEYGTFTVRSPETYGTTVIITANDDMYKADRAYNTNLTFPTTVKAMLRDSCTACGIPLLTADFPNGDFIVTNKPSEDYTHRQIIGNIAMIAVGNARINRQGYLEILPYDLDYSKPHHVMTEWSNLKLDASNITITGIQTTKSVTVSIDGKEEEKEVNILEGSEGYVLSISNPLIVGKEQTVLSRIAETFKGFSFRKFEGDYIAYPIAEFMDLVEIVDRRGKKYKSFITDVNFVFFGFTTLKNSAESGLRNSSMYGSGDTDTIIAAKKLADREKTERELAVEKLNQTLKESSGMYSTDEKQPDGSLIHYLHDKPTLAESKNVIKTTAEAIGFSNDGGNTYPYGFTLNGETIMRIIQTEGINADWLNTGAITVKDDDGTIIFSVDIDTGKVIISGDSVMIGGKTVTAAFDEVNKKAENARTLVMSLSNEFQAIPTDAEGNYASIDASTTVTVLYGYADVSADCTYNIEKGIGVSGTWNAASRTYTVSELNADTGWVDITATYMGLLSVAKRFTLSKVKNGMPGDAGTSYILESSVDIVKQDKDHLLNPNQITFNAYKMRGDTIAREAYSGHFIVEETSDGSNWVNVYESSSDESSITHYLYTILVRTDGTGLANANGDALVGIRDVEAVRCSLYSGEILISRQTVSIVKNIEPPTHDEVFDLLTNGGEIKGIYKVGNQLYINATYLATGMLTDVKKKNYWNLDTGDFRLSSDATFGGQTVSAIANSAVAGQTQTDIFNKLTKNGTLKGIYMENGQLYISFTYAKGGSLVLGGSNNVRGILKLLDANNKQNGYVGGDGIVINSNYYEDTRAIMTDGQFIIRNNNGITFLVHGYSGGTLSLYNKSQNEYISLEPYSTRIGSDWLDVEGNAVFSKDLQVNGDLAVMGKKPRLISTLSYGNRLQYCYEMPSPMFGDIGQASTDDGGICYIYLDDIFSETANSNCNYYVFLQKEGNGDLWVSEKTPTYFMVKGTKNLNFSWEVKVKQKGYENERLDEFNTEEKEETIDYEWQGQTLYADYILEMEKIGNEEIDEFYTS